MLGEKIGSESGRVIVRRVLPNPGGAPKMEVSSQTNGTLLGVKHTANLTYVAVMRPDGTLYGEGQAVAIGEGGEMTTWTGTGVGRIKPDGAISYRGAIYFQSHTPKWSHLNSVAVVFEYDVDAQGNTKAELWEWK